MRRFQWVGFWLAILAVCVMTAWADVRVNGVKTGSGNGGAAGADGVPGATGPAGTNGTDEIGMVYISETGTNVVTYAVSFTNVPHLVLQRGSCSVEDQTLDSDVSHFIVLDETKTNAIFTAWVLSVLLSDTNVPIYWSTSGGAR